MLKVKNVCLRFSKEFYALYDISFDVKKGESVALLGKEDSGKTTLLRVLAKLEKVESGEIYIKDIPLKKLDFKNDISMGYFPSTPVFMERKTVKQNLEYVLLGRGLNKYEIEQKINESLIAFDLAKSRDEKVKKLSLFDKYIVSLIRLSFRKLDLVLIDNIFDKVEVEEERQKLIELISKLFIKEKVTSLIATTDEEIANKLCSRIIKFNLGSIEN